MAHRVARLYVQKKQNVTNVYVQGRNPKGQYYMWDNLGPFSDDLSKADKSGQLLARIGKLIPMVEAVS